eukprot:CAMPEP_0174818126 /NCGR_PEP_ID=MMETSP1107-20130205/750_1 /TAXON_ID=36770 /ORGANISM="Paraphysomonas vestita, Strain GFlagA" /LENGTH=527 /DNA_ID=CAMNT_0016029569 /DNA_START=242 /DNA_END=1829 /DNA_ORIENTATION=+
MVKSGGRILLLTTDGGEYDEFVALKKFLDSYGISCNNDSVLRSVYYKYLHPKEVFIADGILVPDIARKKNSTILSSSRKGASSTASSSSSTTTTQSTKPSKSSRASPSLSASQDNKLPFVYPYGTSLNVQRPSRPLLTSGPISYPMNRPIAAMWESDTVSEIGAQRGRMVLIGSVDIFGDDWLDKEENAKLCDVVFTWLLNDLEIDMTSDRQDGELIWDYTRVPSIEALSSTIKPCLQGMDELPRDFTKLFDTKLFTFDTALIPEAVRLYSALGVTHDPLTLIPPQFECPLPKLTPAVFPPAMRELPPPALDQFDLDEHFAKESLRLAQLTNKCSNGEDDLEYFILESGEILGITGELPFGERTAKHVLFHIFKQIVDWKKQDSTGGITVNNASYYDDGLGPAPAYEYDGSPIEATAVAVAHISHVDLAPMKDNNIQSLKPLDSSFQIGGPLIGGAAGKTPLGSNNNNRDNNSLKRGDSNEKEWKAESKKNAFGGSDGFVSESKDSKAADRKPRRNQAKDDVQIMKF